MNRLSQRALLGPIGYGGTEKSSRPDSELTLASLAAKHDLNTGGLDPRAYQIELFERAKARNIIAVLDTGMLTYYLRLI